MSRSTSRAPSENPITLGLLFYIVTLGAIISAAFRHLIGNEAVTRQSLALWLTLCVSFGVIAGTTLGWVHFKGLKAALASSLAGILVGGMAGGLMLVSGSRFFSLSMIAFGGCWLLVSLAVLTARWRPAKFG